MSIFQKSVIKNYLSGIDSDQLEHAYHIFQKNYSPGKIEKIKTLKEEEYQDGFLRDIFVDVLGYTLKPDDHFNLVREFKNQSDGKKADGAILNNGNAKAVIELKSTKTKDLKTITAQAFNYKNNQPECHYVITSNFQKLRFYIDYAHEYEEFDLFRLNRKDFDLMFLILCKESILHDTPDKLKKESISHEERVSKQLYADYAVFRNTLFENITKNNPTIDQLTLFRKSQTLIDRFLFILFAEDKGLLPPNSINRIIERFYTLKDEDAYKPLYEIYTQYFGYMNIGRKGKRPGDDIPAYNGGLFYPDDMLHTLKIDDDILIHDLQKLSVYDFDTEVDVNILGHIFEHSLSEIEEITARITGTDVDKSKSKRKKDGIFYTPQYITQYIVENTVGRLCEEKRHELDIKEIEFDDSYYTKKGNLSKKGNMLYQKLEEYKNWLLSLKILDPACGSGAFLNQALTFLIREHNFIIDVQTDLKKGQVSMFNVEKAVLENNLYGVDINEESVEITKLSLWLRTAHRKRKLSNLNSNIRCGNSLIDDPEIAGDKAFTWEEEFSEIMESGGFDVVIGNPPYVRVQQLAYKTIDFLKKDYKTALKRIDISLCFIELSSKIIKKDKGLTSFITSNQFLTTEYGQAMRTFLLNEYNLIECVDFGDLPVFSDALTYVSIFTFSRSINKTFNYFNVNSIEKAIANDFGKVQVIDINQLSEKNWNLKDFDLKNIYEKLNHKSTDLGNIGNAWAGLFTGKDDILMFSLDEISQLDIEKEILLPVIRANNCSKYFCSEVDKFVIYPYKYENGKTVVLSPEELQEKYPRTFNYLATNKAELGKRQDSRKTFSDREDWYSLTRFGQKNIFDKIKIVSPGEVKEHKFCIDYSNAGFSCARVFAITIDNELFDIKYVLCLLNSQLMKSYLQSFSSLKSGGYYSYSSNILNRAPIKQIPNLVQQPFIEKADIMLAKNKELHELKADFFNFFTSELTPQKITKKLKNWNALDWEQFKKELTKCKIKALSLKERKEWQDYFIEQSGKADKLKSVIDSTDKEIDRMVYELYGLTHEEIKIVEASE